MGIPQPSLRVHRLTDPVAPRTRTGLACAQSNRFSGSLHTQGVGGTIGTVPSMFDPYQSSRMVDVGGVNIAVTDNGPEDGEPVVLIHGFPDSARLWRHQIPALAEAGHRVVAPDLRGFGRSDRPEQVADYSMTLIAADVTAILDELGIEVAHIVGHDWGAALAWYMAETRPERFKTLVALSAGHQGGFTAAGVAQREKSWYMLYFLFEGLAEERLPADDWYWLRAWARSHSEIDNWIADLSRPGALTAALNIYRANIRPETWITRPRPLSKVELPVLGVWSAGDVALTEMQMTASEEFVAGEWRYERIEDVGHWIPLEAPERLNELLLDWLESHR
jgi:pimeloyl-ACP methyl ester carboxylesterase